MATLTVLKFSTPEAAEQMGNLLKDLQREQLISIADAAIVSWPVGSHKPRPRQLYQLASVDALGGAFWGMLFGLLFFVPLIGMAINAARGALFGAFADIGIDDHFVEETRSKITEGTSALFLLAEKAMLGKVVEAIKSRGIKFELIASSPPKMQEENLRRTIVV